MKSPSLLMTTSTTLLAACAALSSGCKSQKQVEIHLTDAFCTINGKTVSYDHVPYEKITFFTDVTDQNGEAFASKPLIYRFVEGNGVNAAYQSSLDQAEDIFATNNLMAPSSEANSSDIGSQKQMLEVKRSLFAAQVKTDELGHLFTEVEQKIAIKTEYTQQTEGTVSIGISGYYGSRTNADSSSRSLFTVQTIEEGIPFTLPPGNFAGELQEQSGQTIAFENTKSEMTITRLAPWSRELQFPVREASGEMSDYIRVLNELLANSPEIACKTSQAINKGQTPKRAVLAHTAGLGSDYMRRDKRGDWKSEGVLVSYFDHQGREVDCITFVKMARTLSNCTDTFEATVRESVRAQITE